MHIPKSFKEKITNTFGEQGHDWLARLETTVQNYADHWQLSLEGPVGNLSYNYVVKAKDNQGVPVILKLGIPGFDFTNEIKTVQAYHSVGCAGLLKSNPDGGAMLLEQLVPGTMLKAEVNEQVAIEQFVKVWKAIRRPISTGLDCPTISDWAKGLKRYLANFSNEDGPIITDHIKLAYTYFKQISETSEKAELLHGDLHHQNILFSEEKGWLAIDPKGVAGDRYFDLISFLVNELHNKSNPKEILGNRVDALVSVLDLDRERLLKAAFAMATLYACWGIEDKDPEWENSYLYAQWFAQF
ncbi:aminoglycoside phosphotransferase family protein [Radiobacillus sp. PE A8.2]|uniref:aminoglycoside phosphotransferase family protein n=1 Tax=Radiobacillus sp. PE A8.2 TaxID=3380349 RepID=UPI00388F5468